MLLRSLTLITTLLAALALAPAQAQTPPDDGCGGWYDQNAANYGKPQCVASPELRALIEQISRKTAQEELAKAGIAAAQGTLLGSATLTCSTLYQDCQLNPQTGSAFAWAFSWNGQTLDFQTHFALPPVQNLLVVANYTTVSGAQGQVAIAAQDPDFVLDTSPYNDVHIWFNQPLGTLSALSFEVYDRGATATDLASAELACSALFPGEHNCSTTTGNNIVSMAATVWPTGAAVDIVLATPLPSSQSPTDLRGQVDVQWGPGAPGGLPSTFTLSMADGGLTVIDPQRVGLNLHDPSGSLGSYPISGLSVRLSTP